MSIESDDIASSQLASAAKPKDASPDSTAARRRKAIASELGIGHGPASWLWIRFILSLLPQGAFSRTRALILRAWGIKIGSGVLFLGTPVFAGDGDPRKNLVVGKGCIINWPVHFDLNGPVTIGDGVSIGHHVVVITTDHEIGKANFRAGNPVTKPVTIGSGAWIGASATILPGVEIGSGAIVAVGSLVAGTVQPNMLVGGVPARAMRDLGAD